MSSQILISGRLSFLGSAVSNMFGFAFVDQQVAAREEAGLTLSEIRLNELDSVLQLYKAVARSRKAVVSVSWA